MSRISGHVYKFPSSSARKRTRNTPETVPTHIFALHSMVIMETNFGGSTVDPFDHCFTSAPHLTTYLAPLSSNPRSIDVELLNYTVLENPLERPERVPAVSRRGKMRVITARLQPTDDPPLHINKGPRSGCTPPERYYLSIYDIPVHYPKR